MTGGSHGLGKAICLNLGAEGVSVAINYRRDEEKAKEVASLLKKEYGVNAICVRGDITSEEDVKRIFDETMKQFKLIDILMGMRLRLPDLLKP